tara:strand:- start:2901 stop:7736 length:4836 start_codon:yes stop_codon:yes gene_type:complete
MPIITTNFIAGRMNQSVDERLVPPGEYISATNVRLGATETTEIGALENSKGNTKLTTLQYNNGTLLAADALCIGAYDDGSNETMYWFVASDAVDMIVSYETQTTLINYHVVDTGNVLNFDSKYLITGVNKIGDLLFFTDDKNPPRKINVKRAYTNVTAFDLNVIVQPPLSAPTISLFTQATEANFMETRMISFAYRYQYLDEEYSALSQFTDIAFAPGVFAYDPSTNLNKGMTNIYNAVSIGFNTGGANVIGIDLIFKFANSNILNIIEKFKKDDFGWSDNSIQTQTFSNSKIYTTLPESELLRLYDNVPLIAKAQTIMANRLVYGNYEDGRDVVDSNGVNCRMTYAAELNSQDIQSDTIETTSVTGINYTIDTTQTITGSAIDMDFSGVKSNLKLGAFLGVTITYIKNKYTGNTGTVTGNQGSTVIEFLYTLTETFSTVQAMAVSDSFKAAVVTGFQTVGNCATGTTFTDTYNCSIENPAEGNPDITWQKDEAGITGLNQGILITSSAGSDIITLQLPAMRFSDIEGTAPAPPYLYAYYNILNSSATFVVNSSIQSLHSNRNYEVGIVYMDEYLRSTTALVSQGVDPTVFVPASNSTQQNKIKVTIPISQNPPQWATKYKFVVKKAEGPYETIYSNFYYSDSTDNSVYFKLEGQNQNKIQTGDILRIKADSSGAVSGLSVAEVLSIEAKERNFLTPSANVRSEDANVEAYIAELPGLYMQMKPTSFNVDTSGESNFFDSGRQSVCRKSGRSFPGVQLDCFKTSADGQTKTNLAIPVGSLVTFQIEFKRIGQSGVGRDCGKVFYIYNRTFQASTDYDNMFDFVNGEGIDFKGGDITNFDDAVDPLNVYINTINPSNNAYPTPNIRGTNQYQFTTTDSQIPSSTNQLSLALLSGISGCASSKNSCATGRLTVQIADSLMIFESTPIDIDNDIYYENDTCYDITGGFHMSGSSATDQNQTDVLPAIVNLGFFDCYSFGNGVESFKIKDSLVGQSFELGQRVTSVSQQDFKKADRFAGLTYSGTYNEETNINKLNEFNLGLVNFKDLEVSYGSIEILSARETDILVLQEDKISYVLAGKNLLSSASAGGAITNTAEVLGTQIARVEEFGISHNPESFVTYGFDKYFTDAKRNVVLKLTGNGPSEQLAVISETGMRSFFRNMFTTGFQTQKLGGFDPYMNEFVLSSNSLSIPVAVVPVNCGSNLSRQGVTDASSYTLILGNAQGSVVFDFNIAGTVNLQVVWDGAAVINQSITGNSSVNFIKNLQAPQTAVVTITPTGTASFDITPKCPVAPPLIIRQLVLGSPADIGKFIHTQFFWTQGSYSSPTNEELIQLNTDTANIGGVYNEISGLSSVGVFPPDGATVTMQSNKKDFDDFVFDPAIHKFRRFVSPFDYSAAQWITIESNSSDVTPIANPSTGLYQTSFTYNNPSSFQYLYMTWDLRTAQSIDLRHGLTTSIACCSGPTDTFYIDTTNFATATAVFTNNTLHNKAPDEFYQAANTVREQVNGLLQLPFSCVACGTIIPLCFGTTADDVCCTACTYTSYSSSVLSTTRSGACGLSQTATYYHNGTGTTPVVNNFVFSDNKGTTKLGTGYYSLNATVVIYVNSSGMVEILLTC